MSAEPSPPIIDLAQCMRWRGQDMRLCACRLPLGGWAECPAQARGVLTAEGSANPAEKLPAPVRCAAPTGGFTGDACDVCGNFRLVRTGTCTTCLDCGSTGGCG